MAKVNKEYQVPCVGCIHNAVENFKPMTQADRIRSMADEELAEWIGSLNACVSKDDEYCYKFKNCNDCRLEWLKSEVGCEK